MPDRSDLAIYVIGIAIFAACCLGVAAIVAEAAA